MEHPTFLLTNAAGDSTPYVDPTDIGYAAGSTVTTIATDPTHLTLDPDRPSPNVLTDHGRHQLKTESQMTEDEINSAVAKLKTVTLTAAMDYRGESCSHVFDDLSEVSKTDSLQLESLMIHHIQSHMSYNRKQPMNPYRLCVDGLPIRARSYIVLNDYDYDRMPTTFVISTPAQSSGADSAALTFAWLCKSDQESIHFGLLENSRAKFQRKVIEGGMVPDRRYLSVFASLATRTAPQSVTLVDVLVNGEGSAPLSSDVFNIDDDRAREAIQARIQERPGAAAERQRKRGVKTEYTFIDRETFNASHAGQVLAAHLEANEANEAK